MSPLLKRFSAMRRFHCSTMSVFFVNSDTLHVPNPRWKSILATDSLPVSSRNIRIPLHSAITPQAAVHNTPKASVFELKNYQNNTNAQAKHKVAVQNDTHEANPKTLDKEKTASKASVLQHFTSRLENI